MREQLQEDSVIEGPYSFVSFTSSGSTSPSQQISEKFPKDLHKGGENEPFCNIPEHFVLSKTCLQRNILPEPNLLGIYHSLTDLGEEIYPTPASLVFHGVEGKYTSPSPSPLRPLPA